MVAKFAPSVDKSFRSCEQFCFRNSTSLTYNWEFQEWPSPRDREAVWYFNLCFLVGTPALCGLQAGEWCIGPVICVIFIRDLYKYHAGSDLWPCQWSIRTQLPLTSLSLFRFPSSVTHSQIDHFKSLPRETRWPTAKLIILSPCPGRRGDAVETRAGLRIKRFEPWPGSLCCVLGQDTLLSQCLSPPRSKWVPVNCQGNLTKCWKVTYDGLASHPGGVAILPVASCYRNRDKLRQ